MKKILVPTDFSETSTKALDYACTLASHIEAEITLFHSWHVSYPLTDFSTKEILDITESNVLKNLNTVKSKWEEKYPKMNFNIAHDISFAIDGIVNIVEKESFDLVVMGTTGSSGIAATIIGSTTSKLIGNLQIPLITVSDKCEAVLPKKIGIASDFKISGDNTVFDFPRILADKVEADICFIHVSNPNKETQLESITKKLQGHNFDEAFDPSYHEFVYESDADIEHGILEAVKNNNIDLLTIIPQEHSFLQSILKKSISKSLVDHAKLPLIVLPRQKEN